MKRFFKVFLSILFVVALATSIAACGQIDDKDNDNPTPDNPTPDAPNNPDTPSTPDAPNNPDTPSTPDAPNNPNTPTEHVHAYGEWETVTNPTCIANGERKRICSCGKSETETISALGHDFESVFTTDVEPTCTLKGSKSKHCTRCEEKTEVTDIAALGHTEVIDPAVAATCTEKGKTEGKHCSVCNEILEEQTEIAALGHDYSEEWTIDVPATCVEKGSKSKHCSRCEEKTEVTDIDALGHTEVIDPAVAATCTEKGKTEGKHCSVCNKILVAQTEIAALGHNIQNGICTRCNAVELTLKYSYNSGSKTYAVIGYSGNGSIAIIPDTYDDGTNGKYPVTSIGSDAFYNCSGLTSVTIPDSVTSIGEYAFEYCRGLTSVTIPDSVTSIGSLAFFGCSGLTGVTIGNSVTSIGDYAFKYCSRLTSITIPDSVKSIGDDAFYNCSGLTSVTIGNSVTSIGDEAFRDCYKLVEVYNKSSLNITVRSYGGGKVGYYAKAVYIEEYTSKLSTDENGYIIYTDGEDKILIGYVGTETELTLPEGITKIYGYAFYKNNKITKVIIPDSVTNIGYQAFYNCSGLTSVTIGSGVTSIGSYAFYGCYYLTIYCKATSKPSGWNSDWNYEGGKVVWGAK